MTKNTIILPTKLSLQDARDFGVLEAQIENTIDSLRDMLDAKSIYYVEDDFTRNLIGRRVRGLKEALHLKRKIFDRLNYPTEL